MEVSNTKIQNGIILYNRKQYRFKLVITDVYTRYMVLLPKSANWINVNILKEKTRKELVNKIENEKVDE